MSTNNLSFKIRGSYPNYYMLMLYAQKGAREFEKDREPEGNKPGTVIYNNGKELAPRWYDIYYMLKHSQAEAAEFLELLIAEAEHGSAQAPGRLGAEHDAAELETAVVGAGSDAAKASCSRSEHGSAQNYTDAAKKLSSLRQSFYEECCAYVKEHPLVDSPYVTSALSQHTHNVYTISHKGVMLTDLMRCGYAVPDFSILTSKVFEEAALAAHANTAQAPLGSSEPSAAAQAAAAPSAQPAAPSAQPAPASASASAPQAAAVPSAQPAAPAALGSARPAAALPMQAPAPQEEKERFYLRQAVENLEIMTGNKLGSSSNPLIMALRSTMPQYIPGLMPTLLNVGTTQEAYKGLIAKYGTRMASRIYWNNLMGLHKMLFGKTSSYETQIAERNIDEHTDLILEIEREIEAHPKGKLLLSNAFEQLYAYFLHIKTFYQNNQDLLATFMQGKIAYPSLILQKMVWTIGSKSSYPGVLYSRHSRTGLGVQIESYPDIFGEEIMTGNLSSQDYEYFDRSQIKDTFPAVYHFDPLLPKLEKRLASPVTIEFGAESVDGKADLFAVLQINESELTGRAALLSSVALFESGTISKYRVGELVRPYHRRQIFSERIDDKSLENLVFFGKGVNVLPRSAVSARLCFSTATAIKLKEEGEKVCLCKERFLPEDTIVLGEMDAIVGMTPAAIHVVTACRGYGIPAFLSLQNYGIKKEEKCLINPEGLKISDGDYITLSSKNASIYKGKAKFKTARFLDYLSGVSMEMNPKEEKVFINMKTAYEKYTEIVTSIQVPDIVDLNNLVRLIRSDLNKHPQKAKDFVNKWFSQNAQSYVAQLLESSMGSHQDQYRVYDLLTMEHKIDFFTMADKYCLENKKSGLDAGSFMLGRFVASKHPIAFWKNFKEEQLAFMLNEYVLYEKYLNVLYEVGEQQITKARKKILSEEISSIEAKIFNVDQFISLKLCAPNWDEVENALRTLHNKQAESLSLLSRLRLKYSELFNYNAPWSIAKLEAICKEENLPLPSPSDV